MSSLAGRSVIVTGVGPGLGRSLALACARAGADVVIAARTQSVLDEVAVEIEELGVRAVAVPTDVTDDDARRRLVQAAKDELGALDGIVNSAFVQPPFETMDEVSRETWMTSFDINCHAAVALTQAAIPHLVQSPVSSVVFVTTMSLLTNRPRFGAYTAAKAAASAASKVLAAELGPRGVRVNCVAPGYIWGLPVERYLQLQADARGVDYQVLLDELLAQIPLRRVNTPDEIANAGVFLLSELARGITGITIDVNGGQTIPT
jgi:NAD(P)-dependent dehydrogenase (short-subunit alcohol dehydrogenase family)